MPCHPARARELVRKGKAVRRFNRGLFYIQLTGREDGDKQPIAVEIDPGSKKEGITVKSEAHTYLNIQADAVTWVTLQPAVRCAAPGATVKPPAAKTAVTAPSVGYHLAPRPGGSGS